MTDFWVTNLTLSHFRSHRRTDLAFDGRPVAIFGANGAGKTNILEAISLLSPGRGLRRAAADEMARRPEAVGWKVTARIGGHEVETSAEPAGPRAVVIDGKPAPQVGLLRVARVLWLVPAMDRLWIEGADGRRRFLDRMVMSFLPAHADAVIAYEKAMRERNRLLKDDIRDPGWYGALEGQMATAGAEITVNRQAVLLRLTGAMTADDPAFPAAELILADAEGAAPIQTADALAQVWAEGRGRDMAAGRTLSGPHRADLLADYAAKAMPAAQCSTGEQKALLISLILANARALKAEIGAPPILLLDEVAAHLDASRAAALYDALCALGAQAFMTGTGRDLFAPLAARAQMVDVTEADGLSQAVDRSGQ